MAMKSTIGLWQRAKRKLSSFELWPRDNVAKAAVWTLIIADIFDLVTTVFTLHFVMSASESNPLMVDTFGNFIIWKAIQVKFAGFCYASLLGYGFKRSTGFKWAFSLPFLYYATYAGLAALGNILIYMSHN